MEKWILILGAGSDIAKEIANKFAQKKYNLILASRNREILERIAQDINIRYNVKTKSFFFDALNFESHQEFYKNLNPPPEGVILAFGYLGDQLKAQTDFKEAKKIIETNYVGAVSILEIIANDFEKRGSGFIIVITSVAGDRGRSSNYIYGSSKAALDKYTQGLRNRLYQKGVQVITVKPGFVRTKMTAELNLPKLLTASPEKIANDVIMAWEKKKFTVYTPWYWKLIMSFIKFIPEKIGVRLKW